MTQPVGKLEEGKFYINGHRDVHGPMEERAPGTWLDENGIVYHPNGQQWNHIPTSAGNLLREVEGPARLRPDDASNVPRPPNDRS